jgi:hypothetical protein
MGARQLRTLSVNLKKGVTTMNAPTGKQSIRCNVNSCTYNNCDSSACELRSIQVGAMPNGHDKTPGGESMCASYKCQG